MFSDSKVGHGKYSEYQAKCFGPQPSECDVWQLTIGSRHSNLGKVLRIG